MFGELVQKAAGGKNIEHAGLQRHDHLVGQLENVVKTPAVQAGGRVEDHMGRAFGWARNQVGIDVPGLNRPCTGRPQAQPQPGRLLAVCIAEHDRMALTGKITRNIGRQRRLTDAAFRIGNHNHRHANLPEF